MPRAIKSYVGQKFHSLTVIEELGGRMIRCRCDCGNEKVFQKSGVIHGNVRTCGCGIGPTSKEEYGKDKIVGKQYGRLTVVYQNGGISLCYCRCGNFVLKKSNALVNGATTSCGCGKLINREPDKPMPSEVLDVNSAYIGKTQGEWTIIRQLDKKLCFAVRRKIKSNEYTFLKTDDITGGATENSINYADGGKWITSAPDFTESNDIGKAKGRTKKFKNGIIKKCIICGKEFLGHTLSKYCDDCWLEQGRKRTMKNYHNRKRRVGDIDYCIDCGKEYVITSGVQKLCSECAKKRANYHSALQRWKKDVDKPKPTYPLPERVKKEKRLNSTEICPVCGKEYIVMGEYQKCCLDCAAKQRKKEYKEAVCPVCGKTFKGPYKTCSPECHYIWRRYMERVQAWKVNVRRGKILKIPMLEDVVKKYKSNSKD